MIEKKNCKVIAETEMLIYMEIFLNKCVIFKKKKLKTNCEKK